MEKIRIFTAADSNYLIQVAALVQSLEHTQNSTVSLTILGANWSDTEINFLKSKLLTKIELDFINVDSKEFGNIKLSGSFPLATIYNLIGPSKFFNHYKKIIYMDSDVIVVDQLDDIWNLEFTEAVGAVIDSNVAFLGSPTMWRPWIEENSNPIAPYLNTGFMIINIKIWNSQKISEKCFELLSKYRLPCLDQDALNLVLNGKFKKLHPRYNLMPYHLIPTMRFSAILEPKSEIQAAIDSPAVIHFHRSFLGKPWEFYCRHPHKQLWLHLARHSQISFRLKINLKGIIRQSVAYIIGMASLEKGLASNRGKNLNEQILSRFI